MSTDRDKKIVSALEKRNVKPCPRCEHTSFSVVGDSEVPLKIREGSQLPSGSKLRIPTIVLICENCGFISQHSLVALELSSYYEEIMKKAKEREEK
jgi:hypothetical protein